MAWMRTRRTWAEHSLLCLSALLSSLCFRLLGADGDGDLLPDAFEVRYGLFVEDTNRDSVFDISDAVFLLSFLFSGGLPPASC